jgi:hypothetical protein
LIFTATTKIHAITATAVRTLAYISNERKTDNGLFVEAFKCSKNPDEAEKDFLRTQNSIGTGRNTVLAQHIIQSFKPNEVTPEKALEIGRELCDRLLKNQYQYMLAVHTDKKHIHCHIVFNNVNMYSGKTFGYLEDRGSKKSWQTLRKISDEICKEHGLSVVKDPEKSKGKGWYEWDKNKQGQSWKTKLKFALDDCVMNSENFEDFLQKVREKNIDVMYNPNHKIDLKFRMQGQEKWSRAKTLGWYYETPQIKKRIEQYKLFKEGQFGHRQRTKIIDTANEKIQSNKGLERWANIQNMKEASRVINILTNQGLKSTDEIESKSISNFTHRVNLVNELNDLKHGIDDIDEQIKNLRVYRKYKPVYDELNAQKSDRKRAKFEGQYSSELDKFRNSAQYLAEKFPDRKLPKEETLQEKKKELAERRNTADSQYRDIKQKIKDLDYARTAVQDYLKNERETEIDKKKKKGDLE